MADRRWEFISRLSQRTAEGKVHWQRTADEFTYEASFPNHGVRVLPRPARTGTHYVVQILNGEGLVVEDISDLDLAGITSLEGPEACHYMRDIYNAARRQAIGADEAIDDIITALGHK